MQVFIMSKLEYTVEDFVLDPEFRKWVLSCDGSVKSYWEEYLKKNPYKLNDIKLARKILLNMARNSAEVSESRLEAAWQNIDQAVQEIQLDSLEKKTIPFDSQSTIKRFEQRNRYYSKHHQLYRMVGILALSLMLGVLTNIMLPQDPVQLVEVPVLYEEHTALPGVKSNLTLQDGSKVILNSGSSLRYIKNFEADQRILELVGEAYFEVSKETNRPFKVRTGQITTTALGTSFIIKAYQNEEIDISLVTGLVKVEIENERYEKVNLVPGEVLNINLENQKLNKGQFDEEKSMAWTRKTILFDHAPISEIIRVLENWYGIEIIFINRPKKDLTVSGLFRDQTLENVLEGLSYSARFEFEIQKDEVNIIFK